MTAATEIDIKPADVAYEPPKMTLNDRCDLCGAEAMVRIILPVPGDAAYMHLIQGHPLIEEISASKIDRVNYDMLFCNHHTNKHELALTVAGGTFYRKNVELAQNRAKGQV